MSSYLAIPSIINVSFSSIHPAIIYLSIHPCLLSIQCLAPQSSMNQSLSTVYQPTISINPSTHNLSIHLSLLSICSPIIYLSSLISIHPQLIYPSDVLPVNPLSNSTIYPSPISTINVSINRSVCTLYHRPTYLSALSIIYQSTISIYQSSHPSSMYPKIYPSIEPSSITSIYPPIQSSSVYHVYPSVSTTYLSSISTISLCNLPSIHLSVCTTYLSICHLPIYINLCIYLSSIHLSVYLYIYPCVYSCGSQLGMTMPLRVCMIRHGDIFCCRN